MLEADDELLDYPVKGRNRAERKKVRDKIKVDGASVKTLQDIIIRKARKAKERLKDFSEIQI